MDEGFLEGLLDNVFSVFPNPRVAERKSKDSSLVAPKKGLERQLISTCGGSDELFVRSGIMEGSDASFGNPVSKSTQHDCFTSRTGLRP
jgi:hypothetical protein